jgi:hypothetical protein
MRRSTRCTAAFAAALLIAAAGASGCGHYGAPQRPGERVSAGPPVLQEGVLQEGVLQEGAALDGSATATDEQCEDDEK